MSEWKHDFNEVKARADVPHILKHLGLLDGLTQRGDELVGRCMLGNKKHGKKDSFAFNIAKKQFQCFACKKRGSVIDFVKYHEQIGLQDAAGRITAIMDGYDDGNTNGGTDNDAIVSATAEAPATFYASPADGDDAVIGQALNILRSRARSGQVFESPKAAENLFILELDGNEQEIFAVLFLDNRYRYVGFEKMFYGTVNTASVHPREVVKKALALNASAVICGHNHTSGSCEPSTLDRRITARLKDALALVDVKLLDHIVVSGGKSASLAERGEIAFAASQ